MKKILICFVSLLFCYTITFSQQDSFTLYKKSTAMIPMRDGVKLFTVIMTPVGAAKALPVLMQRTPYGADFEANEGGTIDFSTIPYFGTMAKEGYIFVFQDIRGKYKSEGSMQIHQP